MAQAQLSKGQISAIANKSGIRVVTSDGVCVGTTTLTRKLSFRDNQFVLSNTAQRVKNQVNFFASDDPP